jgi:hypothetical protein
MVVSTQHGWWLLDDDFGNVNGPAVVSFDGESTLVVGTPSPKRFTPAATTLPEVRSRTAEFSATTRASAARR